MTLVYPQPIEGIYIIESKPYVDNRGEFSELFNCNNLFDVLSSFLGGVKQISQSKSKNNVFRGVHLQYDAPMDKIMRVIKGSALVFNVDLRPNSPTFGKDVTKILSADNGMMCYAPAWCGRAFLTLEDDTRVEYFHNATNDPLGSAIINYNSIPLIRKLIDPNTIISDRDKYDGYTLESWRTYALEHNIFVD